MRKGKGRRSTVRLIREFAQRNVRKKAPRKAQDFCFFSSNGKEKERTEATEDVYTHTHTHTHTHTVANRGEGKIKRLFLDVKKMF